MIISKISIFSLKKSLPGFPHLLSFLFGIPEVSLPWDDGGPRASGVPPSLGSSLAMIQGLLGVHGLPSPLISALRSQGSQESLLSRLPPLQAARIPQLWDRPSLLSPFWGSQGFLSSALPGVPRTNVLPQPILGNGHVDPKDPPRGSALGSCKIQTYTPREKNLPGTPDNIWGSIPQSASSKHTPIKRPSQGPPDRFGTSSPSLLTCRMRWG